MPATRITSIVDASLTARLSIDPLLHALGNLSLRLRNEGCPFHTVRSRRQRDPKVAEDLPRANDFRSAFNNRTAGLSSNPIQQNYRRPGSVVIRKRRIPSFTVSERQRTRRRATCRCSCVASINIQNGQLDRTDPDHAPSQAHLIPLATMSDGVVSSNHPSSIVPAPRQLLKNCQLSYYLCNFRIY